MANSDIPLRGQDSNPNYLISIFGTDERGEPVGAGGDSPFHGILSTIPEEFSLETSSTWHPLLEGILKAVAHTLIGGTAIGSAGIAALQTGMGYFGMTLATEYASQLVWESTSPVTFNIPLLFNAVYDADEEVTKPIEKLLSLTLPSTGNYSDNPDINSILPLNAPGPSLARSNKYHVHIAIGNMFIFENIIVNAVQATFQTQSVDGGDFISANVNLSITTSRILTKQGLEQAFKNKGRFRDGPNPPPPAPGPSPNDVGGGNDQAGPAFNPPGSPAFGGT